VLTSVYFVYIVTYVVSFEKVHEEFVNDKVKGGESRFVLSLPVNTQCYIF